MSRFTLSHGAIAIAPLREGLQHPQSGGFCSFEGWVRNSNDGRPVRGLSYEAYDELAHSEGERIIEEALARFGVTDARCVHRTGDLQVGDLAVWVGASAPHRDEAFRACRYIIDEIKHRLPVWKKEHYLSGPSAWVACTHLHADDHGSAHATVEFTPDYSRQLRLPDVGTEGQARLGRARVLVIGAGGLGCPALAYLAGAGVGTLGIVDSDVVEASNLHRQPLYGVADLGQRKVDAASQHLRELNPAVSVRTYGERLHAGNIVDVFAEYDLVLECSDDLASRYLCSDAAVISGTPVILASVYQYEGQLQIVSGQPQTPCLRCLWPQEPDPAAAGTCAMAGVLGPVPGVLGTLQAMEALKRLLGIGHSDEHGLRLVNLLDLSVQRLAIDVTQGCARRGGCASVAADTLAQAQSEQAIDVVFDSLDAALRAGFRLVDVRDAAEIVVQPAGVSVLHVPYASMGRGDSLPTDGRVLLICASGARSGRAARMLREAGRVNVFSLARGLAGLGERARSSAKSG